MIVRMEDYHILGLSDQLTREVRETLRAPEYGHPVLREIAGGTGPCRACLEQFNVGHEERLLFTYRPAGGDGTLGAPGPVFIHAAVCHQYRGTGFPPGLRSLPLLIEARARGNRIPLAREVSGMEVETVFEELFADPQVEYLHLRHGEAGCYIARVGRGASPAPTV
jgi:hypothetical protein